MKDLLSKLSQLSESMLNIEVKTLIDSIVSSLETLYNNIDTKLKLTTKLSITRKLKLNELYLKLNNYDSDKLKMAQYQSEIETLSKYRLNAINLKKEYNARIKTQFETKLNNQNHKDYAKFNLLYTMFNFLTEDLAIYDENKKKYNLLEATGIFGNQTLISTATIKRPETKKTETTSRWSKR